MDVVQISDVQVQLAPPHPPSHLTSGVMSFTTLFLSPPSRQLYFLPKG